MKNRAGWLHEKKWGVMVHWLADFPSNKEAVDLDVGEWNRKVNSFDVKTFVKQLADINCGWLIFTIGQNSGYYCSPNKTYDEIVGRKPSRLSGRDLINELAEELASKAIKLICYLPSHAPSLDLFALEKLKCTPPDGACWGGLKPGSYRIAEGVDNKLAEFQRNWEAIIVEWSQRWSNLVSGWWFDGCYYADRMYRDAQEPNFKSFAQAARSGNPDSIVAFNVSGGNFPLVPSCADEDYLAGEMIYALPVSTLSQPLDRLMDGTQLHVLTFLGETWGRGKTRFPDNFVASYTEYINSLGGAITYDFPPPDEDGNIALTFYSQLKSISVHCR